MTEQPRAESEVRSERPPPDIPQDVPNIEVSLSDPLSQVTRRERLYLLATSAVGIIIKFTGLIPNRITTFGIRFQDPDQQSLLRMLAVIIAYFLAAFIIYAASDFLTWRRLFRTRTTEAKMEATRRKREVLMQSKELNDLSPEQQAGIKKLDEQIEKLEGADESALISLTRPVSLIRAVFEFLLPIAVAIYAFVLLV